MRRAATAVVVAVVAALVGVAALDAVRGGADPAAREPGPETEAAPPEPPAGRVDELRELGVSGRLVYTDPLCRGIHALALPRLEGVPLPRGGFPEPCSFALSPDGDRVAPPHWRWAPAGGARAACRGRVLVDVVAGSRRETLEGCDPAWRPDGTLTLVRDGSVVAGDGATLVPRAALLEAAARHPRTPASGRIGGVHVVDVAWLDGETAAVALTVRYPDGRVLPQQAVAAFTGGRLAWLRPVDGPVERLRAAGAYLEVEPARLLRRDGAEVPLPRVVRSARTLELSPDGRWVALAVRDAVVLAALDGDAVVALPIAARDLAWR